MQLIHPDLRMSTAMEVSRWVVHGFPQTSLISGSAGNFGNSIDKHFIRRLILLVLNEVGVSVFYGVLH